MLQSMTGFGTKTITISSSRGDRAYITLSLKSLNSRFFEATFKSPQPFFYLETDIVKLLKKRLCRGHIYFTITSNNPDLFQGAIQPCLSTAKAYVAALDEIRKACNISAPVTLDHLIRTPNLFGIQEESLDPEMEQYIMRSVDELAQTVVAARNQEGEALYKDIVARAHTLRSTINTITSRSKDVADMQKKKMQETLQALEIENSAHLESNKTSLYVALDKMDIQEEITRFMSHLDNLDRQINSADIEKGKRIDFIMQEMNREINTIAAKCSDTEIGGHAINVKVELEKIREQIQNVV